jgi:hypothetical protein
MTMIDKTKTPRMTLMIMILRVLWERARVRREGK